MEEIKSRYSTRESFISELAIVRLVAHRRVFIECIS